MKNWKRTSTYLSLATLLVSGCLLTISAVRAADFPPGSSLEVNQLLSDVKAEAIALENDCDQLAQWAGNRRLSWESHSEKLNLIREHVNKAGRLLSDLHAVRDTASPWQQQAIDRIYPLLKELAGNTEGMINLLNDTSHAYRFPEYRDYAKAGYKLAENIKALVSDYVEYGEHEAEYRRLQEKLDLTSS